MTLSDQRIFSDASPPTKPRKLIKIEIIVQTKTTMRLWTPWTHFGDVKTDSTIAIISTNSKQNSNVLPLSWTSIKAKLKNYSLPNGNDWNMILVQLGVPNVAFLIYLEPFNVCKNGNYPDYLWGYFSFNFILYKNLYTINIVLQRDSNLDHQSKSWARWPLPLWLITAPCWSVLSFYPCRGKCTHGWQAE